MQKLCVQKEGKPKGRLCTLCTHDNSLRSPQGKVALAYYEDVMMIMLMTRIMFFKRICYDFLTVAINALNRVF